MPSYLFAYQIYRSIALSYSIFFPPSSSAVQCSSLNLQPFCSVIMSCGRCSVAFFLHLHVYLFAVFLLPALVYLIKAASQARAASR